MGERKTYHATARRDGRWWLVTVKDPDTVGQARTLSEVEDVAREVIGLWFDIDQDTFDVDVAVEIPESARAAWDEAVTLEDRARRDEATAAALRRSAVQALRAEGLTMKDTGRILGLSPQRVHQLAQRRDEGPEAMPERASA
ncbi:antitoxin HicB [Leifsonia virtsii]|uniref:Antitoxin HicB n=1 Tax=Leifsonia virtsii TaxID=3035915 RepID=A0ABT8ITW5_9MICO|nr:antitoxin HicB [Leifsonia virtsii]MDN4595847.1 antitoxin HicB [Leifsonia virtsii]